jgi:RecJ-like exonuclease
MPDVNDFTAFVSSDAVLKSMGRDFECAAEMVKKYTAASSPVILRYHGDCDGICSALSLYLAIKGSFIEKEWPEYRKKMLVFKNPSAIYEVRSVLDDMELIRHMQSPATPLALLTDFSVNNESLDSLKALKKAGFGILIADHHPIIPEVEEVANLLVSPWSHGGSSDYSAGLIAGEIAKRIKPFDNLGMLQKVALTGDKSRLLHPDENLTKKALALDFIASSSDFAESLELYYAVLNNQKDVDAVYNKAVKKIELLKKDAAKYVKLKEFRNGFRVVLLRFDRLKGGEFPGKGKITGEVHDEFNSKLDAPLVTVGYGNRMMHFRANSKAREAGFNANKLIGELKSEMSNAVESGGGHDVAAGLRVHAGFERMVLEEIIKKIENIGK